MPLVRLEDLMHEADVVMLLDSAIPPFDGFLVQRAVGVGVHVIEGAPVGDEDELSGGARVFGCIAGLAEDWRSVSTKEEVNRSGTLTPSIFAVGFEICDHARHVLVHLGKIRRKYPKRVVAFCP